MSIYLSVLACHLEQLLPLPQRDLGTLLAIKRTCIGRGGLKLRPGRHPFSRNLIPSLMLVVSFPAVSLARGLIYARHTGGC